jgi:hypothetical protein
MIKGLFCVKYNNVPASEFIISKSTPDSFSSDYQIIEEFHTRNPKKIENNPSSIVRSFGASIGNFTINRNLNKMDLFCEAQKVILDVN